MPMLDWQPGPHNRWAFQKINEIVPTQPIRRGEKPIAAMMAQAPEWFAIEDRGLDHLAQTFTPKQMSWLREELRAGYTDAIVVAHEGTVLLEHYRNGMMPKTRHLLQSVSKCFAGVLAGQAIERGELNEDEVVSTYVPELADSAYSNATIRQVMDMQVAVKFSENYADPHSELQQQDRAAGWRDRLPGDPADTYEFLPTLQQNGTHGEKFQYCSADTDTLGWVLERVTGMPYATLLEQRLWQQLGMSHDAFITVDPGGFPMANGGLCTTVRDLATFGHALLTDDAALPVEWLTGIRQGGDPKLASEALFDISPGGSYRGHFWHTGDADRTYAGWGIYGQYLWINPTKKFVIAKFSTEPVAENPNSRRRHLEFFATLAKHLQPLT